jgi:hypothetical protein
MTSSLSFKLIYYTVISHRSNTSHNLFSISYSCGYTTNSFYIIAIGAGSAQVGSSLECGANHRFLVECGTGLLMPRFLRWQVVSLSSDI